MAVIKDSNINLATDIGQVLNTAGGSVNQNEPLTYFQPAAKIKWESKHKPLILNKTFCQDFDSTKPNYDAEWWLGSSRMCGLEFFPTLSYATDLPSKYDGNMNGWMYNLPQGGESQPLRLGDFIGYDTDAIPPMTKFVCNDLTNDTNMETEVASVSITPSGTTSVSFVDMPTLKDYYFGVYIKHNSYSNYVVSTSDSKISQGGKSVYINPYQLQEGNYTVYPFIAEERQTQSQPSVANIVYPIPGMQPLSLRIMSAASSYPVAISVTLATALSLTFVITIANNTASSKTFTNNYIRVRPKGTAYDKPLTSDDYEESLGSITVASNSTYQKTMTVSLRGYAELQQSGVIYVSLDSAKIIKNTNYTTGLAL